MRVLILFRSLRPAMAHNISARCPQRRLGYTYRPLPAFVLLLTCPSCRDRRELRIEPLIQDGRGGETTERFLMRLRCRSAAACPTWYGCNGGPGWRSRARKLSWSDRRRFDTARHGIAAGLNLLAPKAFSLTQLGLDNRRCDKNGQIARKHGNTLISTLRQTYGQHFAPDFLADAKLVDVLHQLDEPSLTHLVHDLHQHGQTAPINITVTS